MPRWLTNWLRKPALARLERDIEAALAARKAKRPERSQAAHRGHRTRKLNQLNQEGVSL